MNRTTSFLALLLLILNSSAQAPSDLAVQLSAVVQSNPPQITLNWVGNSTTTQYQVYRKLKTATFWGTPLATVSGSSTQYVDNTASLATSYEYAVVRNSSSYTGYGYINSGIEVPEVFYHGKLILLVDSNFISSLASEITRLINDLEGDGWKVIRHDVLRTGSVTHIKDLIVNDYYLDTVPQIRTVFLLGHIPVPYSGNINPDGHSDHLGAWPADCYYADIDGTWTDAYVNSTTASPPRTQNIPGDGKFDQSQIPSDLELEIGRVDFNDMPSFSVTEQQLLKNYLDKDHEYRKKIYSPLKQAVIDDNFGYFNGEAFAASGFKNFGPLVGASNVTSADYFTSMSSASYAWSYGCGGGTYTSAGGIGSTTNFASSALQGVFTMLFGSYFGDWDSQDNFLKAPLAQGKILTSVWSGRPHYQFHHMGLGENIGYSLLLTQNNPGNIYYASPTGITGRWVHNALMGDPTLRNDVVAPVFNVIATKVGFDCHISWSASTETTLVGYNIYMKNDTNSSYVKLNTNPINTTTYTDYCVPYPGIYTYMVRALKLEQVPSGSYYNMSEGITDTAFNTLSPNVTAGFTSSSGGLQFNFTNTSVNATNYFWDFGNGQSSSSANPSTTYSANGVYTVTLIASNSCDQDTFMQAITVIEVGLKNLDKEAQISLYPNPTLGKIILTKGNTNPADLQIFDTNGKVVAVFRTENFKSEFDLSGLNKGIYFLQVRTKEKTWNTKLVLE